MLKRILLATSLFVLFALAGRARAGERDDHKWVASWATSPATFFVYVPPVAPVPPGPPTTFAPANIQPDLAFPFPAANTSGATDQPFRSIVTPDLWGNTTRFHFSTIFCSLPLTFNITPPPPPPSPPHVPT